MLGYAIANPTYAASLKPFSKEIIVQYLKTTDEEWDNYHASLVDFRNKRLAHFDQREVRELSKHNLGNALRIYLS